MTGALPGTTGSAEGWPVDGILVALFAAVTATVLSTRIEPFTIDALYSLDVAENLRSGRGAAQSVVDFWRPTVPDPVGLWPPLFPALLALVSGLGIPLEAAARAVPIAAFGAFAFAFHALAARAVGRAPGALVTVFALTLPGVVAVATHAWSEAPFLALLTGGLALVCGVDPSRMSSARAALAGLLIGLAAITRYAGVPLAMVAGLAALAFARGVPGTSRWLFAAGALGPPVAWAIRNLAVFGRPFGPALPPAREGMGTQAFELARALRWELVPAPFERTTAVAIGLALALGVGLALALRRDGVGRMVAVVATLLLAVVLFATSTINAPTGRDLTPALPFVILAAVIGLAGPAGASGERRASVTGLVAVLAMASAVEVVSAVRAGEPGPVSAARADRAAIAWLVAPDGAPILSDVGPLVRTVSGRAAVQIPPSDFRPRDYDDAEDARWARAGVREALMAGGPPPAGTWRVETSAGRFTRYVRTNPGTPP
jgi:hypothetical protein